MGISGNIPLMADIALLTLVSLWRAAKAKQRALMAQLEAFGPRALEDQKVACDVDGIACEIGPAGSRATEDCRLEVRTPRYDGGLSTAPVVMPAVATGDEVFDGAIRLTGDEAVVLAVCSADNRNRLLEARGLTLDSGSVRIVCTDFDTVDTVPAAASLHRALSPPDDLAAALTERAHSDPEPGVRQRALTVLRARYPEAAREAAPAAGGLSLAQTEGGGLTLAESANLALVPEESRVPSPAPDEASVRAPAPDETSIRAPPTDEPSEMVQEEASEMVPEEA